MVAQVGIGYSQALLVGVSTGTFVAIAFKMCTFPDSASHV